jgi:hypothetical protein
MKKRYARSRYECINRSIAGRLCTASRRLPPGAQEPEPDVHHGEDDAEDRSLQQVRCDVEALEDDAGDEANDEPVGEAAGDGGESEASPRVVSYEVDPMGDYFRPSAEPFPSI